MVEGSISTSDLRSYVFEGLFYSFGEETINQMITFETVMMMMMNLAMKLSVTVGAFLSILSRQ